MSYPTRREMKNQNGNSMCIKTFYETGLDLLALELHNQKAQRNLTKWRDIAHQESLDRSVSLNFLMYTLTWWKNKADLSRKLHSGNDISTHYHSMKISLNTIYTQQHRGNTRENRQVDSVLNLLFRPPDFQKDI
ncbi:hypothetical protein AVEN_139950-1 [Araneus ventricosus]|uniref:Uncharacterized protein n=1 Tax=Araneus ventricosus TaxID=182803 RepID=A0A4Y2XAR4_ARAVE|nr:hypothetical protein AVEN_139950-1 [Araneus ventricosus]